MCELVWGGGVKECCCQHAPTLRCPSPQRLHAPRVRTFVMWNTGRPRLGGGWDLADVTVLLGAALQAGLRDISHGGEDVGGEGAGFG